MSHHLVSTSGFVPSFPGWKQMTRLNPERYSDHLAWRRVRIFVMNIIVAFRLVKHAGMESNWVQLAGRCRNREYGCEHIVGGIGLDCDWCVWHPVGENWSGSESLLQGLEG